jgi:hypothetical protein
MPLLRRISVIALLLSGALGILFGMLPHDWIETTFNAHPDSGSGLLEQLLILIPSVFCVSLAAFCLSFIFPASRNAGNFLPPRRRWIARGVNPQFAHATTLLCREERLP